MELATFPPSTCVCLCIQKNESCQNEKTWLWKCCWHIRTWIYLYTIPAFVIKYILLSIYLEYASPVCDPHHITITRDIEQVQRRAARFVYSCYQGNSPGCVTKLRDQLQFELLCYKTQNQLIDIDPGKYYTSGDSRASATTNVDKLD